MKQIQNELTQLRENNFEKEKEIKLLKTKLAKSKQEVKQKIEEIRLHQRVLKVRSNLVNCLNGEPVSNDLPIADLRAEIMQQGCFIAQVNNELESKAEELQEILTSLGTKHITYSRQENIIKMLEESKARNQEIQDSQANRIEQLQNEVSKLKDFIRSSEDANESKKYFYASRHARKMSTGNDSENEKNRKRKYEK